MSFEIRLKTGFYATKLYDLLISKNKLVLSSAEAGDDVITILDKDILNVTIIKKKHSEIEVQTSDKIFQGILCDNSNFEEILSTLKENLHIKIICESEYEGENQNA